MVGHCEGAAKTVSDDKANVARTAREIRVKFILVLPKPTL